MDEWTEIFFTYDDVEAGIVKSVLEAEDIQVVMKSSKITPYPVSIGTMGEVRLLVRSTDIAKAEEVMKAMQDETKSTDDDN
jgi:hypothetical protein